MATPKPRESWKTIARRKWRQREAKIPADMRIPEPIFPSPAEDDVHGFPAQSGFFTKRELAMTEATASEVVAKIASGAWSSLEVTLAVCKRAAVAQQLLNCVTEICFEEAVARAKQLDDHMRTHGKGVGPLHGLPISLKDQFNLKGLDSTIGYVAFVNKPAARDATLVSLLANAGAVFYVKTNVPTTLMMSETVNNIFGRTVNPRNRKLTSGGSSGGEAALIAFRGSYLGVGTDIGGSIRHPCSYTGLYGLRPSHGRVPYQGAASSFKGQESVRSCAGPMSRSPEDIRLFMSALSDQKPWLCDPEVLPLPWRPEEEKLPAKLCFGFALGDGYVSPSPPLRRAMEMARTKLLAAGHSVIDFVPHENKEAHVMLLKMWTADGGQDVQRDAGASGEPLPHAVEIWIGQTAVANGLQPQTVPETWKNQHERSLLAERWAERWQATKDMTGTGRPIDGLLIPSTPLPAVRHSTGLPWQYGFLSPLLDLTTGIFPVTMVDPVKDVIPANFKPISRKDEQIKDIYGGPQNHENALVGLSLVARRLEEEKVVAMLELIKNTVGIDYESPSGQPESHLHLMNL